MTRPACRAWRKRRRSSRPATPRRNGSSAEPQQNGPAAAHGPYSELRAAQTASRFATGAERATEPAAPVFDRDAADAAWQAAIESAAIAATGSPPAAASAFREAEKDRPAAEGRYAAFPTPEPAPEPTPEPKPERELTGTAAEIRTAWAMSRTASELEDALAARGISLGARVSAEEAYASERRAAFAKEAGNFAPLSGGKGRSSPLTGAAPSHRLNERTTGDERGEIEGRLAGIDRAALMNVADTQEAMRAASLGGMESRAPAEREQARPPSAIEAAIADALHDRP